MCNLIYQYDDFEDDFEDEFEDEGRAYGRQRRFADPNLNRESGFLNPNRGSRFPCPNFGREEGYPSPNEYRMKVDIPSF